MRLTALALAVLFLAPAGVTAQDPPPSPAPERPPEPAQHQWDFHVLLSNVFDTNIDHDENPAQAYGVVIGSGVQYRSSAARPLVVVEYEAARHSYAAASRWSRLSQHVRAAFERRLHRRVGVDLVAEANLKGTSEDRELSDQYLIRPRVEFRLPNDQRVRVYAAHRLKRYDDDVDRDSTNRYAGLELIQRFDSGGRWELGWRYEDNNAVGLRYYYGRWTYSTRFETPVTSRDRLALEVDYRLKRYDHRLVEVDDEDVARRDHKWIPAITWLHRFGAHLEAEFSYRYETRFSNELDEDFTAHLTALTLRPRW